MPTPIAALIHQGYQPFPNLDTPIANPDLSVSIPWYQLFITLWNRTGGSSGAGFITPNTPPGPPQVVTPGDFSFSPFTFSAPILGQVLVTRKYTVVGSTGVRTRESGGETVEFTRDGTNYYFAGVAPTVVPVSMGDQVRVSWFTQNRPPIIVFFPIAAT